MATEKIRKSAISLTAGLLCVCALMAARPAHAADAPDVDILSRDAYPSPQYHWIVTPVGNGSDILTLAGRFGQTSEDAVEDVPLVSILRDRLPGGGPKTDRLRYVWLLTYQPPRLDQRLLSAVPFFYWPGDWGKGNGKGKVPKPLVDLSRPAHRVFGNFTRDILQWMAFDPMTTAIRASSRAYRSNNTDHERMHVEEAISYLRQAPVSNDGEGLTQSQLNSVIARLALTKTLLGGFVSKDRLNEIAATQDAVRAETIGRNWELLRTSAERTGLLFEPLHLASSNEDYAVLWFPLQEKFSAPGIALGSTWKLLHLSNPWNDSRLKNWKGYKQTRQLDANGQLLPEGATGAREVELVPLAVYSLSYPGAPLLMADFRHGLKPKRREILQRGSNELVMGVLGLSHFANWYYFAGQAAYQFVKARHGSAEDLSARLDAYSEFRVAAALDRSLDPAFRAELQRHAKSLDVNPLGNSPNREVSLARRNLDALEKAAANEHKLPERIDNDRREELAAFGRGPGSAAMAKIMHYASFGIYTRRAPREEYNLEVLRRDRRVESLMAYLEQVRNAGERPEVTFSAEQIQTAVDSLSSLLSQGVSNRLREEAVSVIAQLQRETKDDTLLASCHQALTTLSTRPRSAHPAPAVAAVPRVVTAGASTAMLPAE
jgi:uncharacterized protein YoaH (UPF0181 family)